jgi:hypothetical protein
MLQQAIFQRLNRQCYCVGTNVPALQIQLDRRLRDAGSDESIAGSRPHLFSALPVFVSAQDRDAMQNTISAVESVVELPAYREVALSGAPDIAPLSRTVGNPLLGYDFHLTADGPKLIEINTNPGGALLTAEMVKTQQLCCDEVRHVMDSGNGERVEQTLLDMFLAEWRSARTQPTPRTIAIVDDAPIAQYLYPEFLLFKSLFANHGIETVIVAPSNLRFADGALKYRDRTIDLVYNRLTDFYFRDASNYALRDAYLHDAVVMTPHPLSHALYANKLNLATLTDVDSLKLLGVSDEIAGALSRGIPKTIAVNSRDADQWWLERKQWFFKPVAGFGSRGTYRGDKITRTVFNEIISGGYVAQAFSPPSERYLSDTVPLKFDVRCFTHKGRIVSLAARLYQGQTTNFRTPGGGFAPVYTSAVTQ